MNLLELYAKLGLDASEYERGLLGAEGSAKSFGSRLGGAFKTVAKVGAKALAAASGAAVAFGASSVKAGMEFDSSMSQVAATLGMTMDELNSQIATTKLSTGSFTGTLREFAMEMGRTTAFSATQCADALNYMALAGYDAKTSMDMLPTVLNLAAAGNIDLARASDMVTDAQTAFGLSIERTSQMVDEMAKAASTGNTSVEQLGDAFLVVGGLAQDLNGGMITLADGTQKPVDGLQELEIALTAMANAGIKGSEAGTHMRNMLLKLSSPTDAGTMALEELGVAVFDNVGKMRSLKDIMGDLSFVMGSLSQGAKLRAISDLFNTRDIASAEAIMNALGDSAGAVSEKLKDSGISFKNVSGAVNRLGIELSGADQVLEGMTQDLIFYRRVGIDNAQMLELLQRDYKLTGEEAEKAINAMTEGLDDISNDWDEIGEAILGAEGAAQKMADTQLDNLAGDITLFKSALEGAKITLSDQLTPAIREFVQDGTASVGKVTEAFNKEGLAGAIEVAGDEIGKLLGKAMKALPSMIKAGANILKGIGKGIIKQLPELAKVAGEIIKDLAKYLKDNAPKIAKAAKEVLKAFVDAISDAIPAVKPLGEVIEFLIDNIGTIATVVVPAALAFKAFGKAVDITKTVTKTVDGLKDMATTLLNTSPYSLAAAAAVGLGVAMTKMFPTETVQTAREVGEAIEEIGNRAPIFEDMSQKFNEMNERRLSAAENAKKASDEEIGKIHELKGELDGLIGKNGEVKESDRERADFVAGALLESLGLEYDKNGDLIQQYQDICGNIDTLIVKKQALALLDATEAAYTEALQGEEKALLKVYEEQQKLADARAEGLPLYENLEKAERNLAEAAELAGDAVYSFGGDPMEQARQGLDDAKRAVEEYEASLQPFIDDLAAAEDTYSNYSQVIADRSELMAAVQEGSVDRMNAAIDRQINGILTAENAEAGSLQRQVETQANAYNIMERQVVESGDARATAMRDSAAKEILTMAAEYAKAPAEARAALEPLAPETVAAIEAAMDAMGVSTDAGMVEMLDIIKGKREEFSQNGADLIDGAIEGLNSKDEEMQNAVQTIADNANNRWCEVQLSHSPSEVWKQFGWDMLDGLRIGMTEEKLEELITAIDLLATQINDTFKAAEQIADAPSETWKEYGMLMDDGLVEGLAEKTEIVNEAATEVAEAATGPVEGLPEVYYGIGSNAGNSIASGIESAVPRVEAAAAKIMAAAGAAAAAAAQIASPSKVFMRMGGYLGEGLAVGIEDSIPMVSKAVDSMIETASGAVDFGDVHVKGSGQRDNGFVQNLTINSPTPLTPYEVARQTRNATQRLVLAVGRA